MATYTIADDQPTLTTTNVQANGLAAHHVGAKPGASVGLEVIDFLCLAYNDTDTQRVGLSRITPTNPVAQTPEKFNTHSAASAAVAMEDSDTGWANDPSQIICVGSRNSSTTGTHMWRRGWTRPNPRQGLFVKSGESTYMTVWIHMIAGATAYDGAWDSHITFAEDQAEVSYNRSAYRRRGHGQARAGYYHAKDSKIGFNGLSTAHHGLKDMQPDHAVLCALDWPESYARGSDLLLLLEGTPPADQFAFFEYRTQDYV